MLVYSLNEKSPQCLGAQQFIKKNRSVLSIAHQNILEAFRVITHKTFPNPFKIDRAINALELICDGLSVIQPTYLTHELCLKFVAQKKLKGDKIFDAYLVSTMLSHDIKTIATDNTKDFRKFSQIRVINPFENQSSEVHDETDKQYGL